MHRDPDRYDAFISYATRDNPPENPRITQLVEAIAAEHQAFTGAPLNYFFDKSEIRLSNDWQHALHHGIAESRVFIAFVSPNYLASEWCRREWTAWLDTEIAKHVFSDGALPIYVVKIDNADTDALLAQLKRRQHVEVHEFFPEGQTAIHRADLQNVLKKLAERIAQLTERTKAAGQSANTVPPYNKNFSGRIDELLTLRERLKSDRAGVVCGIHGVGGIGKTELACAYAHAYAGVYPGGRFEVPCENAATLQQAVLILADVEDFHENRINDEQRKTPDALFAAIKDCLTRRLKEKGSVLLVLDNVTDERIVSLLQTGELTRLGAGIHLLATTRNLPPPNSNWLTLGELPLADGLSLLEKQHPFADASERAAAESIVVRLGGFTLAVELVGAWLAVHPGSNYQTLAQDPGLPQLEELATDDRAQLVRHQERSLTRILGPVLDRLSEAERRVLEFAAILPPDTIALPWLRSLLEAEMPEALQPRPRIADPWKEICARLAGLTLFKRSTTDEAWRVRVHRMVQELVRRRMSPERGQACEVALMSLVRTRDAELQKITTWKNARWELDPLEALAFLWADEAHSGASRLLNDAGATRYNLAEWTRAEPLMRRALALDDVTYGSDHRQVARDLSNLAQLLQATNRVAEAEEMTLRALAIHELNCGPDHPDVAISLNNLAVFYRVTNRLAEAERQSHRALAIDEAYYGADHPHVARDLNNLGQILKAMDRFVEAGQVMRRALTIDEAHYGSDHPDVAVDLNNIAQLLVATSRLADAEEPMLRALAIDEAYYGPDHPHVARDLNNLALLLQETNRLSEAEAPMRRALAIDELCYGRDHPSVARDLNNLGALLFAAGRFADAEEPTLRNLETLLNFSRSTGYKHPNLEQAALNYSELLIALELPEDEIVEKLAALGPESLAIINEQFRNQSGPS